MSHTPFDQLREPDSDTVIWLCPIPPCANDDAPGWQVELTAATLADTPGLAALDMADQACAEHAREAHGVEVSR